LGASMNLELPQIVTDEPANRATAGHPICAGVGAHPGCEVLEVQARESTPRGLVQGASADPRLILAGPPSRSVRLEAAQALVFAVIEQSKGVTEALGLSLDGGETLAQITGTTRERELSLRGGLGRLGRAATARVDLTGSDEGERERQRRETPGPNSDSRAAAK